MESDEAAKASKLSSRLWCSGASSLAFGSVLNFVSMGFAPQSLLASLGSVQFVSNVVFGKLILKVRSLYDVLYSA